MTDFKQYHLQPPLDANGQSTSAGSKDFISSPNILKTNRIISAAGFYADTKYFKPTFSGGITAIGNAVVNCSYINLGKWIIAEYDITFGTTTTFAASDFIINLPVNSSTSNGMWLGRAFILDTGIEGYTGDFIQNAVNNMVISALGTGGTYAVTRNCQSAVPFAWGTGDKIQGCIIYQGI